MIGNPASRLTTQSMHALAPKTMLKDAAETLVLPLIAGIRSNGHSSTKLNANGSIENGGRFHLSNKAIPTARKR